MKTELRRRLREMFAAIPAAELRAKSDSATQMLLNLPEFADAAVVMVFLSLPAEVDTTPIILRAWQDHKRVLAPKVILEQRRMLPIEIHSLTHDLVSSHFGIREPVAGEPIPVSLIDLVIVPGLGFDRHGNRLGRGRGFYDRFLLQPEFRGLACALAFEEQVVDAIPVDSLDRPVDLLVTDRNLYRFPRSEPRS